MTHGRIWFSMTTMTNCRLYCCPLCLPPLNTSNISVFLANMSRVNTGRVVFCKKRREELSIALWLVRSTWLVRLMCGWCAGELTCCAR